MAFFNLDCLGGQAEAIIFHDAFDKYKEIIKDNNIVFLVGHTSTQNDIADQKLIVDEVVPINHAKKVLKLNEVNERLQSIESLKRKYGGSIESVMDYAERIQKELEELLFARYVTLYC